MKLACPACGAEYTLDVLLAHVACHDNARHSIASALKANAALADRLMKYLGMFRPPKRQLGMDRLAALLQELVPMLSEQKVARAGREYSTTLDGWKQALDTVLANRDAGLVKLPLRSHGYLLTILVDACEKGLARDEAQHEARLRGGARDDAAREKARDALAGLVEQAQQRAPDAAPVIEQASGPREVPAGAKQVLQALGIGRRRAQ